MKKGIAFIPLIIIVLLVVTGGVVGLRLLSGNEDNWICQNGEWVKHGNPSATKPTTPCTSSTSEVEQGATVQPTEQQNQPTTSVPLPTGEDIVRNFFQLINEGKASEAVMAMSKINTENDSTKQAWGVQFNAFESIKVKSIEVYNKESWTDQEQMFKINLTVQMKPEAANAVMPNYGFDNGDNIRWVTIVKENNLWKINGIHTGP